MNGVSIRDVGRHTFVRVWGPARQPGLPFKVGGRTASVTTGGVLSVEIGPHTFELIEDGVTYQRARDCPPDQPQSRPLEVVVDRPIGAGIPVGIPRSNALPPLVVNAVRGTGGSLTVKEGVVPAAQTVVYIHGIGNKPPASVLKCQWDQALFGTPMGDRSRMAYWVNRQYYPLHVAATCASSDTIDIAEEEATDRALATLGTAADGDGRPDRHEAALWRDVSALTPVKEQQQWLHRLALRMQAAAVVPVTDINDKIRRLRSERAQTGNVATRPGAKAKQADAYEIASRQRDIDDRLHRYSARVLPLPERSRSLMTRHLSRVFLRDAHDFLFDPERRQAMMQSLADRLKPGGGPFVIVAHSLGSLVAWELLRTLQRDACPVRLLVTIGSPLGIQEIQDILLQWGDGPLRLPECVDKWVNVADRLDPVAIDNTLAGEFAVSDRGVAVTDDSDWGLNEDSPWHPHSATGYLRSPEVQRAMRGALGNAFAQATSRFIVSRDLTDDMEDADADQPHRTLIQLADGPASGGPVRDLKTSQKQLCRHIRTIVRRRPGEMPIPASTKCAAMWPPI